MTFNDFHYDLMCDWVINHDCTKLMEYVIYTLQVPKLPHTQNVWSHQVVSFLLKLPRIIRIRYHHFDNLK